MARYGTSVGCHVRSFLNSLILSEINFFRVGGMFFASPIKVDYSLLNLMSSYGLKIDSKSPMFGLLHEHHITGQDTTDTYLSGRNLHCPLII